MFKDDFMCQTNNCDMVRIACRPGAPRGLLGYSKRSRGRKHRIAHYREQMNAQWFYDDTNKCSFKEIRAIIRQFSQSFRDALAEDDEPLAFVGR